MTNIKERKIWSVNPYHITEEDADILQEARGHAGEYGLHVMEHDDGWLVKITDVSDIDDETDISGAFLNIYEEASVEEIDYIDFNFTAAPDDRWPFEEW